MKVGDLVKYKPYTVQGNPRSITEGFVGIVTSIELNTQTYLGGRDQFGNGKYDTAWVMWNIYPHPHPRRARPAYNNHMKVAPDGFAEEWMDELEVINESR